MKVEEVFKIRHIDTKELQEWKKFKRKKDPLIEGWKNQIKQIE
jgi:hypothetical protein